MLVAGIHLRLVNSLICCYVVGFAGLLFCWLLLFRASCGISLIYSFYSSLSKDVIVVTFCTLKLSSTKEWNLSAMVPPLCLDLVSSIVIVNRAWLETHPTYLVGQLYFSILFLIRLQIRLVGNVGVN